MATLAAHITSIVDRLAVAPSDELARILKSFDKLQFERAVVNDLISSSRERKEMAADLEQYIRTSLAKRRPDDQGDDVFDAIRGALRVYLVEDVLAGNTDQHRQRAWDKISGLTSSYN